MYLLTPPLPDPSNWTNAELDQSTSSLEILKVTSGEFMVTEVIVGMNPLGEYEVVGELEFDYVTTRDNTDVLNKFEIVGDLELE